MKIKQIRAVRVNIPHPPPKTQPRRPTWNRTAPRALPINKYPEFSRLPGAMPGMGGGQVWVQDILMHHPFTLRDAHGAPIRPPGTEPHRVTMRLAR